MASEFLWISNMCEEEGISVETVRKSAEYLLTTYYKAKKTKHFAQSKEVQKEESQIVDEKRRIRREYLLLMNGASKMDHQKFVWAALSTSWIDEKIDMVLDQMVEISPEYGDEYKNVLMETYMKPQPLKGEALYAACNLGKSTYFGRRREAIILFGVLTYKYAKKRENEDIIRGDVPPTTRLDCLGV